MKTWLIVAIVAGLFILGGLAIVQALDKPTETQKTTQTTGAYSCGGPGSGTCGGGCTAESNCGYAGCQAKTTGSCGCGR